SGKKTDNSIVLTPGYTGKQNDKGKASSGRPGPSVAHQGLLHTFLISQSLIETLWLNLFTVQQIEHMKIYSNGVGCPPWEKMPLGEDCDTARQLKESLIGRLIPLRSEERRVGKEGRSRRAGDHDINKPHVSATQ